MLSPRLGGLLPVWLCSLVSMVACPLSSLFSHSEVWGEFFAGFSFAALCALAIRPQFVSAAVVGPLVQLVDESRVVA